jgi:hypothetical protein
MLLPALHRPPSNRVGALARAETAIVHRAQQIVRRLKPRLLAEAQLIGGADGLALAAAFSDIVSDGESIPESWPLFELIELLATRDEASAARLLRELCPLALRIAALAEARQEEGRCRTPAA